MILTFVSGEYGKIEINTELRTVYFFKRDEEYYLTTANTWTDFNGTEWELLNDTHKKQATIRVWQPIIAGTLVY